jgi:hypothetical protein
VSYPCECGHDSSEHWTNEGKAGCLHENRTADGTFRCKCAGYRRAPCIEDFPSDWAALQCACGHPRQAHLEYGGRPNGGRCSICGCCSFNGEAAAARWKPRENIFDMEFGTAKATHGYVWSLRLPCWGLSADTCGKGVLTHVTLRAFCVEITGARYRGQLDFDGDSTPAYGIVDALFSRVHDALVKQTGVELERRGLACPGLAAHFPMPTTPITIGSPFANCSVRCSSFRARTTRGGANGQSSAWT